MRITCKDCSSISELMNTPLVSWQSARHSNLLQFADYNNGVSEGSSLYICKVCLFQFEVYSHIGMDKKFIIQVIENLSDKDILDMAHTLVVSEEALLLQKRLLDQKDVQVYLFTDLWRQITFNYKTEKESKLYSLEVLHRFGFNHVEFKDYSELKLSMNDLILSAGKNDLYYKKSFIVSFVLRAEDLNFEASPTSVIITTSKTILPEQIKIHDFETKQWTPLSDLQIDTYFQRDHNKYLTMLRDQQKELAIQSKVDNDRQRLIQSKRTQIIESLR